MEVNDTLTFTNHLRNVAKKAAWKLSCVRRISHLLDARGISTLYAAQVRSVMEYAPLAWSSCPRSYLSLLDMVQNRAQLMIRQKARPDQPLPRLQPLQQRRDVAGLCVMYKVYAQHSPHIASLRQSWATQHDYATRAADARAQQIAVPFARTETFLRSFLPKYARLWNRLVQQTQLHRATSMQTFKASVNNWLMNL